VDDFGSIVNRIANSQGNVLVKFIPVWNGADGHDFYVVGNAVHADAVVAFGGDYSGHMGAVHYIFLILGRSVNLIVSIIPVREIIRVVAGFLATDIIDI